MNVNNCPYCDKSPVIIKGISSLDRSIVVRCINFVCKKKPITIKYETFKDAILNWNQKNFQLKNECIDF